MEKHGQNQTNSPMRCWIFNETNLYGFIESSKANTHQKGYKCCIML